MFAEIKSAVEFAHLLPRYQEIVSVLWKHGFGELLKLLVLQKFIGMDKAALEAEVAREELLPVRVRLVLEELGPTFVKFRSGAKFTPRSYSDDLYFELSNCRIACRLRWGAGQEHR